MNNIEKIKAYIERLYDGEAPKHDQQCDFNDGYFTGLATILNFIDSMPEEKPSEELEKAAEKQINEALFKWSYDDEDGIEQYVHDAFIAGWDGCKEQMMKDVVEGEVIYDLGGFFRIKSEAIDGAKYKVGSWVKLIIVKED